MKRNTLLTVLAVTLPVPAWAAAPDTEAVEYYNVDLNHYFITATATEARIVDEGGAGPGWVRTGRSFQAWLKREAAPADARPVCRFYSAIANSHFYTGDAAECDSLRPGDRGWQYEGVGFYAQVPVNGKCADGTIPMQRLYNNGFTSGEGSNHRFIDDAALGKAMVESGWQVEGAAFCAMPKRSGTNANMGGTAIDFQALGGTWEGNALWEVMSVTTRGKVPRRLVITATDAGAIEGSGYGCTFTGDVEQGDGFRSLFTGFATAAGCEDAAFNGDYNVTLERFGRGVLKARLDAVDGETEISAVLHVDHETPRGPPQRQVEGAWTGTVRWEAEGGSANVDANRTLDLTVTSTGAITGSGFGCTFTGTVGGAILASGCENAVFNGSYSAKLKSDGPGRLEVELKSRSDSTKLEISGVLVLV